MHAKAKVAVFDFITHFGGGQAVTLLLCRELAPYYDVHVIDAYGTCAKYHGALREAGLPVQVVQPHAKHTYFGYSNNPPLRLLRMVHQIPALWRLSRTLGALLADIGPSLVWVNGIKSLTCLKLSGATRHVPVAFYAQGWYRMEEYPAHQRWILRRYADGILAVSTATREALRAWGIPAGRVHVVYNPLNFDEVLGGAARAPSPALPGMDKRPRVVVPGQLIRTKGQHTAVRAAALCKQRGTDLTVWLAGDESPGSRARYREHLQALIAQLGVENNVHLLGWRDDLPAIMARADVVLLPTHTEGLPRVLEEAMLLKKPVITTPVGGIPDLITDQETGLLVPIEDERAVCAALARLRDDAALVQKLTESAYRRVRELVTPQNQASLVRDAFEALIQRGPYRP